MKMQLESKKSCYQIAEQLVKELDNVTFISGSDNDRNLEFVCMIGDIEVDYNFRVRTDLLTIRGTKKYSGLSDSELTAMAQEILKDEKFGFTAYNENIIFQMSIPTLDMPEEDAIKHVNDETQSFIRFIARIVDINQKDSEDNVRVQSKAIQNNLNDHDIAKKEPELKEEIRETALDPDLNKTVCSDDMSSEKEKLLMQIEWIAEKNAEHKRKEKRLQEWEDALTLKEKEVQNMIADASEKTEHWESIQREYSDKEIAVSNKESLLKEHELLLTERENDIKERERESDRLQHEYDQKNKNLTEQQKECNEERERLIQEKEQINREKQKLEEEKKSIAEQQEKYSEENKSLKERCVFLQKEIKGKDASILQLTNDKGELEKHMHDTAEAELKECLQEINKMKIENDNLTQALMSVQDKVKLAEQQLKDTEQDIAAKEKLVVKLQHDIELYKQNDTEMGVPDEILEDFADTRKKNRQLERELNDITQEYETEISTLKEQVKKEKEKCEEVKAESVRASESLRPENRGNEYLADLKACGIILSMDSSTGDVCLYGERDDCDILINVTKNLIIVKKTVFRTKKFSSRIQEWNENEITEMYYSDKHSIICKKVLTDVVLDVSKILQKFMLIK